MAYRVKVLAHSMQKSDVRILTCSILVSMGTFDWELLLMHDNIAKTLTLRTREGSKLQGERRG